MTALVANTFNWFGLDGIANWFKNLDARLEQHRKIKHTMKQLHSLRKIEIITTFHPTITKDIFH